MKDSYLINYNLFCNRRKFSLEAFIEKNHDITYEELKNYFYKKKVEPPSEEIFQTLIQKIRVNTKVKEITTESVLVEKKVEKPKRKTRRRSKKKND